MLQKLTWIALLLIGTNASSLGQEVWSLERCIEHAQKNTIRVKQSELSVKQADANLQRSRLNIYPNLSGGTSLSYNFGRSIDPVSNSFVANNIVANGFSVNSNATLYNGGRLRNEISQNEVNKKAAEEDLLQVQQDVALSVAQAYLQVLLAEEQLKNLQINVSQTEQQLNRILKLIAAGSLPEGERYELDAQLARDEQNVTTAQNNVDLTYLNLKTLLLLDPTANIVLQTPAIQIPDPATLQLQPFGVTLQKALQTQPSLRAGELRLRSAQYGLDIARSLGKPTVAIFGSLGTNYSNLSRRIAGYESITVPFTTVTIPSTGEVVPIVLTSETPILEKDPYFNQLNQNLNGSVALSVSIPIYDKGLTKNQMELARLNIINTELANRQQRQTIETSVQRAITDAKAAAKQLQAAQRTLNASEQAFKNMEKRYNVGAANILEYTTSRNNLEAARFNLTISKYDYIFKLKIVDFYEGKPIRLE